jgi:hypothetical protein
LELVRLLVGRLARGGQLAGAVLAVAASNPVVSEEKRNGAGVAAGGAAIRSFPAGLRSAAIWSAPLAAYALLACAVTWPLPLFLDSRLLGAVSGDIGVYVWNLWIFRHELLEHGRLPVSTDHIFAYTNGVDFTLHNYTPLAAAISLPLISAVGLVAAFNLVLLAKVAFTGLATFGLCRHLGLSRWSAWAAGALFVASPVMVARQTAHPSLVAAAALPLFLWALLRALDSQRLRDGALVGAAAAMATYSDAYYGIYCVLMGVVVLAWRFLRLDVRAETPGRRHLFVVIDALLAVVIAVIAWRVLTGATTLFLGPIRVTMTTLYNPVLAASVLVLLRTWLRRRPRVSLKDAATIGRLIPAGFTAIASCLVLLLPLLVGVVMRVQSGRMPNVETYWRTSPRGVDLLAYLVPGPTHPLLGAWTRDLFLPSRADAFPEFVAAFPWVALIVIGVAAARRALPPFWIAFTLTFLALSLGPFLHVGGQNTYVPGPWAVLRYMPVVEMARSPARFAILATLGGSILVAFAIDWWRRSRLWRPALAAVLVAVGAVEIAPAPRLLYSAEIPALYGVIARDASEVKRVLELPTGIRDGTSSLGNFAPSSMYFQTLHGRPLIGGYLSRVTEARKQQNLELPMLRALMGLSDPAFVVPPEWLTEARGSSRTFLARSCVGFVVVDKRRATPALTRFAVEAMNLTRVAEDDSYALHVPNNPPPCEPDELE